MMNGFGLKYIHRFFNLPFLTLQVPLTFQQMQTNSSIDKTAVVLVGKKNVSRPFLNHAGTGDILKARVKIDKSSCCVCSVGSCVSDA